MISRDTVHLAWTRFNKLPQRFGWAIILGLTTLVWVPLVGGNLLVNAHQAQRDNVTEQATHMRAWVLEAERRPDTFGLLQNRYKNYSGPDFCAYWNSQQHANRPECMLDEETSVEFFYDRRSTRGKAERFDLRLTTRLRFSPTVFHATAAPADTVTSTERWVDVPLVGRVDLPF